jgi:hypothetical protein
VVTFGVGRDKLILHQDDTSVIGCVGTSMITGRIDLVFFIVLISGARVANLILKRGN